MRFLKGNCSVFARRRRENFGILGVGNAISKGKCAPKARDFFLTPPPPPSQNSEFEGGPENPPLDLAGFGLEGGGFLDPYGVMSLIV